MATVPSAKNEDPTLYCQYFGGPEDGRKTGDLPVIFSGEKLTGMQMKTPLWQPHDTANFAVYVCTSETQINGFWRFEYAGTEGPDGGALVAEPELERTDPIAQLTSIVRAMNEAESARAKKEPAS